MPDAPDPPEKADLPDQDDSLATSVPPVVAEPSPALNRAPLTVGQRWRTYQIGDQIECDVGWHYQAINVGMLEDVLIRVLPTLYDTRTKLAREVLSELRAKFRDYLMESTVNFNTKLKEAASFGQPITEYDPGSRGYKDFVNLARELMGHRPAVVEPAVHEPLSRPAELVHRAKQLAQLTNLQFGKNSVTLADAAVEMRTAQTTHLKIDAFYGTRQVDGEVQFAARFDSARRVQIAGDFNNWSSLSTPLMAADTGTWSTRLALPPGRYRYRFVVDGAWTNDPHNPSVETNEYGELNNILEVA
jgi:hypothetical protein